MPKKYWVQRKWDIFGLVGSLALVGVALVAIGWTWSQTEPVPQTASIPQVVVQDNQPARIEVGSEESGELQRLHFERDDGTPSRMVIVYRNDTVGEVLYRPDGTVDSFTVKANDGSVLRESTYDEAGEKVVNGWEKRLDQSMVWKTQTLANGDVKTTTWWKSGKQIFSIELVRRESGTIETTYWRGGGSLWLHQLARIDAPDLPFAEEHYDHTTGKMQWSVRRDANGGAEVSYYRRDGTLHFVRHHVFRSMMMSSSVSLESTTVYGKDGRTAVLEIRWWSGQLKPMNIQVPSADGGKVMHHFGMERESGARRVFTAEGKVVEESPNGADGALFQQIDPLMWAAEVPLPEDAEAARKEQESR